MIVIWTHGTRADRWGGRCARRDLAALLAAALALGLASGGCGYNLPYLQRPDAASSPSAAAAPAKPPREKKRAKEPEKAPSAKATRAKSSRSKPKPDSSPRAKSTHEKSSREKASRQSAPRAATLRDRMDEARERAAAAPAVAYWPFRLGELYASTDSLAPAEAALRQALTRDAGYAPALALLSKLYYDARRHEDAIRLLEAARAESRRASGDLAPELLAGLALHHDALGQTGPAREVLATVPRSAHKATDSAAAALALRHGALDSAAALAQAAVREHPNSAACQNNHGIARLRLGDPEAARGAFLKAVELDPRLPGPYYNLAILEKYYALDDAAASRWFARYRLLATDDPDGLAEVFGSPPAKDMAEGRDP